MSESVIQGWKHFKCNECELEWEETTRDYQSASIGCCDNIDCISEDIDLVGRRKDDTLPIHNGNLRSHRTIILSEASDE